MNKLIIPVFLIAFTGVKAQENPKNPVKTKEIENVELKKKVFEKKSDRYVFDVANSPIAKGTTAANLLQETPMVSMSYDDKELRILGKNAAIVYINGRKSNMDTEAVLEMLKNTPAENISKIEVITVPSSEFQVESNQGIINIVLKKKPTDGYNGNLRIADTQNFYNQPSAGATLNFRKNKLGISSNFNYSDRKRRQDFFLENGDATYDNQTSGHIEDPNLNLGGYLNLDYEISDKQNIGLSYNFRRNWSKDSQARFYSELTKNNVTSRTMTRNDENANSTNHAFNLNYELKTDDKGSKLMMSASLLKFNRLQDNTNVTDNVDANGNFISIRSSIVQDIPMYVDNYGFLADYIKKLNKDYTLSFGGSYNNTETESNTFYGNVVGTSVIKDLNQSNHFNYQEKIGSLYTTIEKNFGEKISTKLGVRFENTNTLSNVIDKNIVRNRNYNNFLPYFTINYTKTKDHNLSLSFSSRVARPSFGQIIPVKLFLTQTNYIQNNPFVLPEKYYNTELNYMYKNAYYVNFSHSFVKDAVEQIPLQGLKISTQEKVLAYVRENYGNKQEMGLTFGMQKQFYSGIWNANNSITFGYNIFDGSLSKDPTDVNNEYQFNTTEIKFKTMFAMVNLNNNIRLSSKKDWFLGVNYMMLTPQYIELGRLGLIQNLSMNVKKIYKSWTFVAEANDIFRTHKIFIENYQKEDYNIVNQYDFRQQFGFSATYNFGNQKLKKTRKIDGANDDIKSRAGGN